MFIFTFNWISFTCQVLSFVVNMDGYIPHTVEISKAIPFHSFCYRLSTQVLQGFMHIKLALKQNKYPSPHLPLDKIFNYGSCFITNSFCLPYSYKASIYFLLEFSNHSPFNHFYMTLHKCLLIGLCLLTIDLTAQENAAPSIHLVSYFPSSDVILKMDKIKIVRNKFFYQWI